MAAITLKKKKTTKPIIAERRGAGKGASAAEADSFRARLLDWYDRHRRVLPWRAMPGRKPDPYHVWLSEIMLQQTVVAAVIPYFLKFTQRWPAVEALAAAPVEEVMAAWAGLGYYARARNMHKCAQQIAGRHGGIFPDEPEALRKLPGIGAYTSAAIAAIAFDRPATVIDGNVDRVIARYFAVLEPLPAAKPVIRKLADRLAGDRGDRPGDFAQAMMDLGATICIPKAPRCGLCPLAQGCKAYRKGLQADLPYKEVKKEKPKKYGYVYFIKNRKGELLLQKRPDKGLLGGMYGLPTSAWLTDREALQHPAWLEVLPHQMAKSGFVTHSFTHFDLTLLPSTGKIRMSAGLPAEEADKAIWILPEKAIEKGLPTLFAKCVRLMTG